VRYRQSGAAAWKNGPPLFRVHPETIAGRTVAPQFAGSILDLRPATTYEIELRIIDPDGPVDQKLSLTGTTRLIPGDPSTPRLRNVSTTATLSAAIVTALPGDVIVLANGTYNGAFGMGASGTAAKPIVIRGASQDGVILDGGNCAACNIFEIYGSYVHLEQMTVRNGQRAVRFMTAGTEGNVVRRVRITNVTMGIAGRSPQLDNYIADNILEGRLHWPFIYTDDAGAHSDDSGIAVAGSGMVVAHNRISGFGDAMRNSSEAARAVDFYGNDVLWTYDNGLELDQASGNARALRNRFTNTNTAVSVQPVYAGPAYIARNIAVNSVDEQIKFHALGSSQPNGVLVYNNTFLSPYHELQVQTPAASHYFNFANNLLLAPSGTTNYAVNWDAPIDNGSFDYNGYFPDGRFLFRWAGTGYTNSPNFAALQARGVEPHGRLLSGQIFSTGLSAPSTYLNLVQPADASLAANGPAIDRGLILPGISDAYTGAGPDLGALELGCPLPVYGPRPAGMDEANEPLGCAAATAAAPTSAAQFVKSDALTQGNWRNAYGAEGYTIAGDTSANPAYGQVSFTGQLFHTWVAPTNDVRALTRSTGASRIAATWYSATSLTVEVNLAGTAGHQVALYTMDWDYNNRSQQVDVIDAATGVVLDTRNVSTFAGGQYLVWNITGHVQIRFTNTGPTNAVVEGVFFGGPSPLKTSTLAQFVKLDSTTRGNWNSAYGAEGYYLANAGSAPVSYGQTSLAGQLNYTWVSSLTDPRALLKAPGGTDRIASCWYSSTSFTLDVNLTGAPSRSVAIYILDYDYNKRTQRVDVIDPASGAVLDSRSLVGFSSGQYLVWNLTGHVKIRLTNTGPTNAVVGGIFFGGPRP
jgi:hypothetical protein